MRRLALLLVLLNLLEGAIGAPPPRWLLPGAGPFYGAIVGKLQDRYTMDIFATMSLEKRTISYTDSEVPLSGLSIAFDHAGRPPVITEAFVHLQAQRANALHDRPIDYIHRAAY